MDGVAQTECGVFACISKDPSVHVAKQIYLGLMSLQHRGQEAAGISVVAQDEQIHTYKNHGLVFEGISQDVVSKLWGNVGIGHVRYGTAGSGDLKNAQPFHYETTQSPPFSLVFNGNITNYKIIRDQLSDKGRIFLTNGDTEVIANLIASNTLVTKDWVENLEYVSKMLDGSYSIILLTHTGDVYCYRQGNKPLIFGQAKQYGTNLYYIASESAAITSCGAEIIRDVKPGEILHVHQDHFFHTEKQFPVSPHHCIFEYVYFARADSTIDERNVHETRMRMGANLAMEHNVNMEDTVVIPVPDSGRSAALGFARVGKHEYEEGLMKNRYVFRSFIQPTQADRETLVNMKLNPIREIIKGKNVVLIDDSIVRGTTMKNIVALVRKAGANTVHVRSSSPPIAFPCFYGVDFPSSEELIYGSKLMRANSNHEDILLHINEEIGADSVAYLSIEGLIKSIDLPREKLCLACLNGDYWYEHDDTKLYLNNGRI